MTRDFQKKLNENRVQDLLVEPGHPVHGFVAKLLDYPEMFWSDCIGHWAKQVDWSRVRGHLIFVGDEPDPPTQLEKYKRGLEGDTEPDEYEKWLAAQDEAVERWATGKAVMYPYYVINSQTLVQAYAIGQHLFGEREWNYDDPDRIDQVIQRAVFGSVQFPR